MQSPCYLHRANTCPVEFQYIIRFCPRSRRATFVFSFSLGFRDPLTLTLQHQLALELSDAAYCDLTILPNAFTCSLMAVSVGRRSIELAP